MAMFALLPCIFFMIVGCMFMAGTVFWVWMFIDCIQKEPSQGNDKILWVLIILFLHFVGALLYFLIRRPQRMKETGQ